MSNVIVSVRKLLELIRFSHTIFALPFALLSAAIAWKTEPFRAVDLLGVLLGMVFARSFAMAFNRLVDRDIDGRNPRTANRHLPAGTLSVATVTAFLLLTAVAFIASTGLFLLREPANRWPLILSGPVLLFLAGYSLAKRFTALAHVWLGAALMLAPVAAWIAVKGPTDLLAPILLGGVVLFWVTGFDILYGCQDTDFDRRAGLHSIPARFGVRASLRIAAVSHVVMFGVLVALAALTPLNGPIFWVGGAIVGGLLVYEHALVKPNDLTRVNQAFFQVNGVISIGLLVVGVVQLTVN